jgi:hypothetical protein
VSTRASELVGFDHLIGSWRCLGAVNKPAGRNAVGVAGRRATSPTSSEDLAVSLHSMQEQIDRMESTQSTIVAHQKESDLHAERLDAKLESIAAVIMRIDQKLSSKSF